MLMSVTDAYRLTGSVLGALLLGSITVWAIGSSPSVVVLGALSTIFFIGQAVSVVVGRVSQYQRSGMLVIGLVAAGTLLLGHRSELAFAMALIGLAGGIDLLLDYYGILQPYERFGDDR